MNKFKVIIFSLILVASGLCYAGGSISRQVINDPDGKKTLMAQVLEENNIGILWVGEQTKEGVNVLLSKLAKKYGDTPEVLNKLLSSRSKKDISAQIDILMDIHARNNTLEETAKNNQLIRFFEYSLKEYGMPDLIELTRRETRDEFNDFAKKEEMELKSLMDLMGKAIGGKDIKKVVGNDPKLFSDDNIYKILDGAEYSINLSMEKTLVEMANALITAKKELGKNVDGLEDRYKSVNTYLGKEKDRDICNQRLYDFYDNNPKMLHNDLEYMVDMMIQDNDYRLRTDVGVETPLTHTAALTYDSYFTSVAMLLGTIDRNFKDGLIYQIQEEPLYANKEIKDKISLLSLLVVANNPKVDVNGWEYRIEAILGKMIKDGNCKSFFADLIESNFYKITEETEMKASFDKIRKRVAILRDKLELSVKEVE